MYIVILYAKNNFLLLNDNNVINALYYKMKPNNLLINVLSNNIKITKCQNCK